MIEAGKGFFVICERLFSLVNREMAILFVVKRDLDLPFTTLVNSYLPTGTCVTCYLQYYREELAGC